MPSRRQIKVYEDEPIQESEISSVVNVETVENTKNPIIYIFLNKSLGMSVGKASAQAAHAAAFSVISSSSNEEKLWQVNAHKTIIVLEARDDNHMRNIASYLEQRNIYTNMIVDEGVNEIDPHSITALSTGILDKNDENVSKSFSTFKLYRDLIELSIKVPR